MTSHKRSALLLALAALTLGARPTLAAQCGVSQMDVDGDGVKDLRITGATIPQKVIIDAYQDQTIVSLDCNGDGGFNGGPATGDLNQRVLQAFGRYEIRLKGKDNITFNIMGDWNGQSRSLEVALTGGLSRLNLGGTGALLAGSRLLVNVMGTIGEERLAITLPTMDASSLILKADLNIADNGANIAAPNPITGGSVVAVSVAAGGFDNDYGFNHTGLLDGSLDVSFEGGSTSKESVTANFAGPIGPAGRLRFRSNLGSGADSFVGNVDLGALSIAAGGELHVDVLGGAGPDRLNLSPGGTIGGTQALDGLLDVALKGGEGDDVLAVNLGAGGLVTDGILRLRVDGESGLDTLNTTLDVPLGSATPKLDVALHGGHGTDAVNLVINDNGPGGALSYRPAGTAFVDGGTATDTCVVGGSGRVHVRNCE
jgi:hypothetical protein